MTLVELLVSVMMLGLLMIVLSSAIIVTLRQQDNTEGRLNVARAEQTVSMWMPADLASASKVDTSPQATPCGAMICDGIDLSRRLERDDADVDHRTTATAPTTTVNVSYHFAPSGDGVTYNLSRVECTSIGRGVDLPQQHRAPRSARTTGRRAVRAWCRERRCVQPAGQPGAVHPPELGDHRQRAARVPTRRRTGDVIDPGRSCNDSDLKDANRVIVSINGGGDADGAGGGINQISITAGGTVRNVIDAKSLQGTPSFVEARSRCGGPITLVIDESGSIGSTAIDDVKRGVTRVHQSGRRHARASCRSSGSTRRAASSAARAGTSTST